MSDNKTLTDAQIEENKKKHAIGVKNYILTNVVFILFLLFQVNAYKLFKYVFNVRQDLFLHSYAFWYISIPVVLIIILSVAILFIETYITVMHDYNDDIDLFLDIAALLKAIIVSIVLIAWVFVTAFSLNNIVGTVHIDSVDDLDIMRKHPSYDYQLDCDIDMSDSNEWIAIKSFSGKLYGNGHAIKGICIGEQGFIKNNKGLIDHVNFYDVEYACNYDDSNYKGLIGKNKGVVQNCRLRYDKKEYEYDEFANLVGKNTGVCSNNKGVCTTICNVHNYEIQTKIEPTFLQKGYSTYTCKTCKYSYNRLELKNTKLIVLIISSLIVLIFFILIKRLTIHDGSSV